MINILFFIALFLFLLAGALWLLLKIAIICLYGLMVLKEKLFTEKKIQEEVEDYESSESAESFTSRHEAIIKNWKNIPVSVYNISLN
jgi:hypothetical protein